MAGDWMKVEKDTPDKPEVLSIAERLGITPEEAFGRCFKVWRWGDSQTTNGYVRGVTLSTVDRLSGLPGFGLALVEVGWLHDRSGALQLPNFDRHMGQSAKNRALTAIRMKKSRVEKCDDASVTKSSPEKRREEKSKKKTPLPPGFDLFWKAYPRKEKKPEAIAAWRKANPDEQTLSRIIEDVGKRRSSTEWIEKDGKFIPHPATYLNNRRWEDEGIHVAKPPEDPEVAARRKQMELLRKEDEERAKRIAAEREMAGEDYDPFDRRVS